MFCHLVGLARRYTLRSRCIVNSTRLYRYYHHKRHPAQMPTASQQPHEQQQQHQELEEAASNKLNHDSVSTERSSYPATHRGDHIDHYGDINIADPYQWLEDADSMPTQEWVQQQNIVTHSYLSSIGNDTASKIKNRLQSLYNYARYSCPINRHPSLFYFKNDGLQNQSVLYQQASLLATDQESRVLLDPNLLSSDGTAALGSYEFSQDGTYFAYGISRSGSDWQTIEVLPVYHGLARPATSSNSSTTSINKPHQSPQDGNVAQDNKNSKSLGVDVLEWVKFSNISWTHDCIGFFYSRYPAPRVFQDNDDTEFKRGSETEKLSNQSIYYHRLHTKQNEDVVVYKSDDEPKWMHSAQVSDCGRYVLISISESTDPVNRLYWFPQPSNTSYDTTTGAPSVRKLIDNFDAEYSYITNEGSLFFFKTNLHAPRYRVIAIDFNGVHTIHADKDKPTEDANKHIKEIIPQTEDVLNSVHCVNRNQLVCCYMRNASELLQLFNLDGKKLADIPLPDIGSISGITGRKQDSLFFYQFTSFLHPGTIYCYDLSTADASNPAEYRLPQHIVFRETKLPDFDVSKYATRQVWYPSKDGTQVPMFIIAPRNYSPSESTAAKTPILLYGYGGFSISITPSFAVSRCIFLQHMAGLYVVANLRGGGEFGEEWHQAGMKNKKQNVFDDFHAAAEYLIQHHYTIPSKVSIMGGSNGGLLVAACINQRPSLYGAAISAVGVLDMLKYHKFTIGYAWMGEYGSSDNSDELATLLKYSPLHNIHRDTPYPALILTTGDHDDRVVPLHSYKYISELQYRWGSSSLQRAPLLIRIETKAGHGAGMPLSKRIEEQADVFTFISKALNVPLQWQTTTTTATI